MDNSAESVSAIHLTTRVSTASEEVAAFYMPFLPAKEKKDANIARRICREGECQWRNENSNDLIPR